MELQVGILGPLVLTDCRRLSTPRARKQRALVAALALRPAGVVPVERVIDLLWGDEPPLSARQTLRSLVSRIRHVLGPDAVRSESGGSAYRLDVAPAGVDAQRFLTALTDAKLACGCAEYERSARLLNEALAEWRGDPLVDLADGPAATGERTRLHELRLDALDARFEVALLLGRHREVIGELEAQIAEHPLREQLWAHLMVALYLAGRQADALQAYQRGRAALIDQLGVEPGPRLRELEAAILAHRLESGRPLPGSQLGATPDASRTAVEPPRALSDADGDRPAQASPSTWGAALRLPFVGRARELALFDAAVRDAVAGRGGILIIEGEQGSGKSRLLEECGRRARSAGVGVLEGRALDAPGTPPFWLWRSPLEELRSAQAVSDRLPAGAPTMPSPALGDDWARAGTGANELAVLEAMTRRLLDRRPPSPVVILLDDLHWADEASVGLLAHVALSISRSSVLVFATWCPEAGGAQHVELLSRTARRPGATRIQLGALTADDVSGMLVGEAGEVEAGAHLLVDVTGGNAFLLSELIRLTDGRPPAEAVPLPPSVPAVVSARLKGLPAAVTETLEAAGVLGRRGSAAVLAETVGCAVADVADAIASAVAVGLLDRSDDASFQFRHALVQQALGERLAPTRRADLHLAAARALQARRATDDLWVIAHHLTMAARVHTDVRPDAEAAWRLAARRAGAVGAHGDAAAHLAEAVMVAAPPDRPRLLVDLGFATLRAGRPTTALDHFWAAARGSEDAAVLAAAALGYEDAYLTSNALRLQSGDPSIELLTRALDAQAPGASVEASLCAALARAHWYSGLREVAGPWLARVESALLTADTEGRMHVAFARRVLSGAPGDAVALADACAALAKCAGAAGRHDIAVDALRQRVLALVELGELDEADQEIDHFERLVNLKSEVQYVAYGPLLRAMRMLQRGELQVGRRLNRRAAELGERIERSHMAQLTLMQLFAVSRWTGSTARFADELLAQAGPTGSGPLWYGAAALAEAENGRHQRARDLLRRGLGRELERVPVNEFWLFALCLAAVAADAAEDREHAALLHSALSPYTHLLIGNVAPIIGPISFAAGLAALAAGLTQDALLLLHEATCRVQQLDCPPWLVECLRAEARALEASGGDDHGLRELADSLARRLGMRAPGRPMAQGPGIGDADGVERLSRRERNVLALLAEGRTNQEIASNLYISYRTAKTHVSSILTKLGARNRNEAAAMARRAGLGP